MIKIHRDNRVIFWLLIGGLVLNILWSLRLELHAQTSTNAEKSDYYIDLSDGSQQCYFKMNRQKPTIKFRANKSGMVVGKFTDNGGTYESVLLGVDDESTLHIFKGKGIQLSTNKVIDIRAEGTLDITADGDINIKSKNGVVKINGKKINMNKEDSKSK